MCGLVCQRIVNPASRLAGRALRGIAWGVEQGLSTRGLQSLFLVCAAGLVLSGWLRPPLARDISSLHIPLGVVGDGATTPEEILFGPRRVPLDSIGIVLLALLAGMWIVLMARPERFALCAGVLLCVSLAANAAVALNHPALIELLDYEYEQRQLVSQVLNRAEENAMVNATNGRIGLRGSPVGDQQRGDMGRGWVYLLYGRWLVGWSVLGLLLGAWGPCLRRAAVLARWGGLGVVCSLAVCLPRLHAEYHWNQANRLEASGCYGAARHHLRKALHAFPALERLERSWLLSGKLDFREGRVSAHEKFYRAYQLARDKSAPRGVTYQQDTPWAIFGVRDERSGLTSGPSGFNMSIGPGAGKSGIFNYRLAPGAYQGRFSGSYPLSREDDFLHAIALMEAVRLEQGEYHPALAAQAARLWAEWGLTLYRRAGTRSAKLEDKFDDNNLFLAAAQQSWLNSWKVDPRRRDCAFYLGTAQAQVRGEPQSVESLFAPLLSNLGDQMLQADIMTTVADSYFEAGQVTEARRRYARSFDTFCLPKVINKRAQSRLGGL